MKEINLFQHLWDCGICKMTGPRRMKVPSDGLLTHQSCFPRKYSDWYEDWGGGDYSGPCSPSSHWSGVCASLPQFGGAVLPGGVWLEHGVSVNCCLLLRLTASTRKPSYTRSWGRAWSASLFSMVGLSPFTALGAPRDDTMSLSTLFQE